MKKSVLLASAAIMMCYFTSCSGGKKTEEAAAPAEEAKTEAAVPEYKLMNDLPTVDLSTFPKDADAKSLCSTVNLSMDGEATAVRMCLLPGKW